MKYKYCYSSFIVCVLGYTNAIIHPPKLVIGEGQSATFTCRISANYTWYKNDHFIQPGHIQVHGDSIQIANAALSDSGIYRCKGRSDEYGDFDAHATLTVQKHRFTYVQPKRLVAEQGESAHFTCTIKASLPLTWYKDEDLLPQDVQVHQDYIIIPQVRQEHGGKYECFGKERITRRFIKGLGTLIVGTRNDSLISPQVISKVKVNSHVVLQCFMHEDVLWRFNGGQLRLNARAITEHYEFYLEIKNVQGYNEGIYECSGKINGKYFVAHTSLEVFVLSKVTPEKQIAREGDNVTFKCLHDGIVNWTFNNNKLPANSVVIGNMLTLYNIRVSHRGYYICRAMSKDNQKLFSSRAILKVIKDVQVHHTHTFSPSKVIKRVGDDVRFQCTSPFRTEWRYEGKPLPLKYSSFHDGVNIMELTNLAIGDSGIYSCFGIRDDKYFESEQELIVMDDCPEIDLLHGYVEDQSQQVAKIRCRKGYSLKGSSIMYCNSSSGEWSSSSSECEATDTINTSPSLNIAISKTVILFCNLLCQLDLTIFKII